MYICVVYICIYPSLTIHYSASLQFVCTKKCYTKDNQKVTIITTLLSLSWSGIGIQYFGIWNFKKYSDQFSKKKKKLNHSNQSTKRSEKLSNIIILTNIIIY